MLYCDWLVFNSYDWHISIFTVLVICSLSRLLSYWSPAVVFLDHGHPCFWNFYSAKSEDRNAPITAVENRPITAEDRALYCKVTCNQSTSSPVSKRRDLHPKTVHGNTLLLQLTVFTTMNNHNLF